MKSDEAYVISLNIEGGWRFNFDVLYLRDSNNKKILNFTLNCIWNMKVRSIFDWFNIQRYFYFFIDLDNLVSWDQSAQQKRGGLNWLEILIL